MMFKRKPCLTFFCVVFVEFVSWHVNADVYMHNPRGSNNRLNEANNNRNNANRLFDSQNNNRGGYNVGIKDSRNRGSVYGQQYQMEYFMSGPKEKSSERNGKSFLTVEWTNQHGCGDDDLNCNIVLQYKCQKEDYRPRFHPHKSVMRNGLNTGTPNERNPRWQHGLHEPAQWYERCKTRSRNKGLFIADQNLQNRETSKHTRQNPNGQRRGLECPEERDYYPYWHPTDWIDEAVYVKRQEDCAFYTKESFNQKERGECLEWRNGRFWSHLSKANNYWDCRSGGGTWVEFSNFLVILRDFKTKAACETLGKQKYPTFTVRWGIPYRSEGTIYMKSKIDDNKLCLLLPAPPKCQVAPTSRPNHLGNGEDVTALRHQWILPYFPDNKNRRCVFRIRYNISTDDYNVSTTTASSNERKSANIIINQSPITNNPEVSIGDAGNIKLQLAINTAQFGRTFQDRSHIFKLIARPSHIQDSIIHNINVRGKRGNIVQVYPGVEYDFIPKRGVIRSSDLVHFQWTGSNSNPNGNAGEGKAGTDRSNILQMVSPDHSYPMSTMGSMVTNAKIIYKWGLNKNVKNNKDLAVLMASSCQFSTFEALARVPNGRKKAFAQLDYAPASRSLPLLQMAKGEYFFMCTRNNNFSNRSQKGRLVVQ